MDVMVEVVKTVDHRISKFAEVVLKSCAYACTGNVLEVGLWQQPTTST